MLNVLFVAPYFGANMLHCVRAFANLEGVRLGLITNEPEDRVPAPLRAKIQGHYRLDNCMDPGQLTVATRAFQKEWGRVDRLIGYLEQMQVPLAQARDACDIDGMRTAAAQNFRDKNRMKQVLREAGLPVARQARVRGAEDALRFVGEVGYPIVMKPLAGLGSRNTMRVRNEEELYAALNVLTPSPSDPVQAEEFVQGDEHTFETVSIGGKPVWSSSTYYLPGPLQVLENPWMQYCVLLPREQHRPHSSAFAPVNAAALTALGMVDGLSHMEWFLRANGQPVVSEVGARPPGVNIMQMNAIAHGVDFWGLWAKLMAHRTWEIPERKRASGCAFLRGQGRGRMVKAVHGLVEAKAALGDKWVDAKVPQAGQPVSEGYEGEGYVVVQGPTTESVLESLKLLVTKTYVERG